MRCKYKAYYFESFPIDQLFMPDFSHMHIEGLKTGGMKKDEFLSLYADIEKNGLTNPIVVEVDSGPRYRVAMGNNRTEVLKQLGHETIKSLVLFNCTQPTPDLGDYTQIVDSELEEFMKEKHPGDDLWKKSGWADRLLKFVAERGW